MQIDLVFIAQQSHQNADDYEAFGYFVELDERSDFELDALVEAITAPIIAVIDCKTCANCCRVLDVYLTEADAQRLSTATFIPLDTLLEKTIDRKRAADDDEWGVFRQRPCGFLHGNLCSVYPDRPESCRTYPVFTPDFRWMVHDIIGGVGICPIIYHTVEQLKTVLGW